MAQRSGKSQLCRNWRGKGMTVPGCNGVRYWGGVNSSRRVFPGLGVSEKGWNGLMQNVGEQGDSTSEKLRSLMVIRAGDTGRQVSHSEIR